MPPKSARALHRARRCETCGCFKTKTEESGSVWEEKKDIEFTIWFVGIDDGQIKTSRDLAGDKPANSPDLSPMDYGINGIFKNLCNRRTATTKSELMKVAKEV